MKNIIILFISIFTLSSCITDMDIEIPAADLKTVIEASIETNSPPIVLITKSVDYYAPTNFESFSGNYIHDAVVSMNDGESTIVLEEICAATLTPELLPIVAELTGYPIEILGFLDLCVYTTLDPDYWGQVGKTYTLKVDEDGNSYEAWTRINEPIALDSTWFSPTGNVQDTFGIAFGFLNDPDTSGNSYRWYAQRISHYGPNDSTLSNQIKDSRFIAPIGSSFTDDFFNGLEFEFSVFRGSSPITSNDDDKGEEAGLFLSTDSIAVKFCTIDIPSYEFLRSMDNEVSSAGSPFANPSPLKSNFSGGALGSWIGYSPTYDTIYPAQ